MKLGILSDLHVDLADRGRNKIIPALTSICKEQGISYLLLAGDLTNNYLKTLEILDMIEAQSQAKCLFVPGNHDIWNLHYRDQTSWELYHKLQSFPGNLTREAFHLNEDWVVIGDLGWYDYSFGNPRFSVQEFDQMEYSQMCWQDGFFANWGQPSQETSHFFYRKLKTQLEQHQNKKIILLTHVVPHQDFLVRSYHEMWQYFNAFLGNREYGELAMLYGVKYYVFGHVHYRLQRQINGVRFICNSLGYPREWLNPTNPEEEVRRAFTSIEV